MRAILACTVLAAGLALGACADDDAEDTTTSSANTTTTATTGSGTGGDASTTSAGGSSGQGGMTGQGGMSAQGGGGACTAFGEACTPGATTCCDAAGEMGTCYEFGDKGARCTIPCPSDPQMCPMANANQPCNNKTPPVCKVK